MSNRHSPAWANFLRTFRATGRHRHRYEVFRDFVTIAAISLHNQFHMMESLEQEYFVIMARYSREEFDQFPKLLGFLIQILEEEPRDVLGQLYMELELQNENVGQFFTPPAISELMARLSHGESLANIGDMPFITVSEPACGAGGMILAFTKVLIEQGYDPAQKMWVECRDIDRTAALMCYAQLALWNVPGVVIVGNTLSMEVREVFYTPAHYLYRWDDRLAYRRASEAMLDELLSSSVQREPVAAELGEDADEASPPAMAVTPPPEPNVKLLPGSSGVPAQFDFGF